MATAAAGSSSSSTGGKIISDLEMEEMLDRMLTRLALCEDPNLQNLLSKLLPLTISALSRSSSPIRTKVMEILSHVNKRVKHQQHIGLPLEELWHLYMQDDAALMVRNFCIVYVEMAFDRLTEQNKENIAPTMLANISKLPSQHQDIILRMVLKVIGECHSSQISDEIAAKYRLISESQDREMFVEFCLHMLLYQPPSASGASPPGLSLSQSNRVVGKTPLNHDMLLIRKLGLLNVVDVMDLPAELVYPLYVAACADRHDPVIKRGEELLKKKASGVNLEDPKLINRLFLLFNGTVGAEHIAPDSRVNPGNPAMRAKIDQLKLMGPVILGGVLKSLDGYTSSESDSIARETKTFAFQAIGLLAKRLPQLFRDKIDMAVRLFNALKVESPSIRLIVQEATNSLAVAYKDAPATVLDDLESLLLENSQVEQGEVRFCALRWATTIFDSQHCPSRFICMLGAADAKLDIREMALEGLFLGKDQGRSTSENTSFKHPKLAEMLNYIVRQQPQLLESSEIREERLLFPSQTYVAAVRFLLQCFEADVEQNTATERTPEFVSSLGNMCLLLEHAMAYEGSVDLHATASKALIKIGSRFPEVEDILFAGGEALSFLWGGVPVTTDMILKTDYSSLSMTSNYLMADIASAEPTSKFVGIEGNEEYHVVARDMITKKLFDGLLYSTKKEERCSGTVWLVSLTMYCGRHPSIQKLLPDIQEAFSHLIGEQNELTQELASQGLSIVYELGDASMKKNLVNALVGTLTGTGKRKRAVKLAEDTEVFQEGSIGGNLSGGKLSTYKELCSLANEMGQPDLVYKFMDLANHQASLNSKRGAAFGFSKIAKLAGDALQPYLRQLVPRLVRYQYDPDKNVQDAMAHIWKSLVADSKKTIDEYLDLIIEDLLVQCGSRLWRSRESSCLALADLIQGRKFDQVGKHLKNIWTAAFRAMDDIKETVRTSGERLCRAVTSLTLRLCDISLTEISDARKAMDIVLPLLLTDGIMSKVDDIRKASITIVTKLAKGAGIAIRPHLSELVVCMLESLSSLEDQGLNYVEAAKAVVKLCEVLEESVSSYHQVLLTSLMKEVPGRIWEGKEDILEALSALCTSCHTTISAADPAIENDILSVVTSACNKKVKLFRDAAFRCLDKVLKAFKNPDFFGVVFPLLFEMCNGAFISKKGSSSLNGTDKAEARETEDTSVPHDKIVECITSCVLLARLNDIVKWQKDLVHVYSESLAPAIPWIVKVSVFTSIKELCSRINEGLKDSVDVSALVIEGCEREVAEAEKGSSDERKSECLLRLSWALVHSKRPDDVQRGIAMLEGSLPSTTDPLQMREKMYLLAVGYYRSGDYSRSRQLVDRCLEIAPDWRQALTLKKSIEDHIKKDGVIGIGIAATAVGLVAGGLAAALSRKK
ncbi:hypothetical protein M8C21_033512 [Ambrosia artemisiifolia]|uniref:Proteasome component Ecm29 N-terminal domain-containing protein n=1 Tax=Ambrosia artemisiifolia TaxID=4212 RepID=A0AAD5BX92_AMBAR|nr:hypothetical protein M8C21_033512 [Ambrosia artemisiifolia]